MAKRENLWEDIYKVLCMRGRKILLPHLIKYVNKVAVIASSFPPFVLKLKPLNLCAFFSLCRHFSVTCPHVIVSYFVKFECMWRVQAVERMAGNTRMLLLRRQVSV